MSLMLYVRVQYHRTSIFNSSSISVKTHMHKELAANKFGLDLFPFKSLVNRMPSFPFLFFFDSYITYELCHLCDNGMIISCLYCFLLGFFVQHCYSFTALCLFLFSRIDLFVQEFDEKTWLKFEE